MRENSKDELGWMGILLALFVLGLIIVSECGHAAVLLGPVVSLHGGLGYEGFSGGIQSDFDSKYFLGRCILNSAQKHDQSVQGGAEVRAYAKFPATEKASILAGYRYAWQRMDAATNGAYEPTVGLEYRPRDFAIVRMMYDFPDNTHYKSQAVELETQMRLSKRGWIFASFAWIEVAYRNSFLRGTRSRLAYLVSLK